VRLDAHQHFWRYSASEFGWIDERMARIRRDFLPADLEPELRRAGLDGCLAVQARSSRAETEFVLELARANPFVKGVVGWTDLCAPDVERELERLAREPRLKGLRHVVQDEPDERFLERADFRRGVRALARHELVYELLVYSRHLPLVAEFVAAHAGQSLVLDHLGKPRIAARERESWERPFRALGAFPRLACKLSGLVTEAAWNEWTSDDLRYYLDVALETFGEERILFGSDWPVCLLAARDYGEVFALVDEWAAPLCASARAKLFGLNAARIYCLS